MRKIVVSEYLSLDGIMSYPAWTMPYWNDEISSYKGAENDASDALLLGRVTYQEFAKAWPDSPDEGAARMNEMPKYVASNTLDAGAAEWNATIIKGDLLDEIGKLRNQSGGDLLVYGSGDFVNWLIQNNLVDEYHLLVYPVVIGEGKAFFQPGLNKTLELAESKTFSSGVVALTYRPAPASAQ
ncbi:MAG: dihydrofolate reductase [Chloroflexi bacterium]|nr:dihydrofolate reductase [Chloroflexota bacterium]OJV99223.1 MAG: pyrimidine reductase [Chloroflexi bacterium 54-19]